MTLHYIDGFEDHVASYSRWSASLVTSTPGRFGVGSRVSEAASEYVVIPDTSEIIVGAAVKVGTGGERAGNWYIGVGNSDGAQLCVRLLGGTYRLARGAITTDIITSSGGRVLTDWAFVEFRATLADSGGTAELWVNGVSVGTFTGDTRNSGTQTVFNRVYIGGDDNWNPDMVNVDDLYVIAVDGTSPNTRLGDCRVTTLFPNGNGTTSGGTGSDGNSTDNYLLVDETSYNAADYVDFATTIKDTYAYGNASLDSSATVHGVQVCSYVAKTDAGSITAKPVVRLSGTEVDGTAVTPTGTTAVEFDQVFVTKPGGGAWGASDIDSAEFGLKGV